MDATYPNANAITYDPSNYNIEIMFNPNELERPALDIARTLVHELIHAEMYRKLLSVTQKPEIPWTVDFIKSLRNDFPGLYDYYMRWAVEKPEGIDAASPQHQIMAQHYRDIIEQGLREFDNSYPSNIYENLVWVGLQNTVAWNNLGNDTLDIKQKVFNFFSNNPPCSD